MNQPSRWVLLLLFGVVFLSSLLVDEIQGLSSSLPSSCTAATTTATAPPPPPTNNQSPCLLRSRRQLLQETWNNGVGMFVGSAILGVGVTTITPSRAEAAPPISIISEELGYFPVTNNDGELVYVPKRIARKSSPQSIALAKRLQENNVKMYGAYWCPHCSRQKELFGAEAWSYIEYVECGGPKGYKYQGPKLCNAKAAEGYPTWEVTTTTEDAKASSGTTRTTTYFSGEHDLDYIAQYIHFPDFDPALETDVPSLIGAAANCKLR